MKHVIFDWNGTLLDDVHLILEADNYLGAKLGLWGEVSLDYYRENFTRNWRLYYGKLAGCEIGDELAKEIHGIFHDYYFSNINRCRIFADALAVLNRLQECETTMSINSMCPHEELLFLVRKHQLEKFFCEISGHREIDLGGSKTDRLKSHLERFNYHAKNDFVLIGDNLDDGIAASGAGISAIMVTTGEHSRKRLSELSWPVVDSLTAACELLLKEQLSEK